MNGFRIDFAMNRGHEMLIDRMEGIFRHELDELELRMLQSIENPYLLPVDWQELNGAVTFSYKLGGCRMLQHELRPNSLTMLQYYELLLHVTDALDECRHYMLRPDGCLLEDCFIFTNGAEHIPLRFVYMPMKEVGGASGTSTLLSLIVRWTSYIEVLDGEGLKQIMQAVTGKKWPLAELRDTLLGLIAAHEGDGGKQLAAAATAYEPGRSRLTDIDSAADKPSVWNMPNTSISSAGHVPQRMADDRAERGQASNGAGRPEKSWAKDSNFNGASYSQGEAHDEAHYDADDNVDGSRYKWITAALGVLITACNWRFIYLDGPSNRKLLISAALTLLVAGALLFLWRKKTAAIAENVEARFASEEFVPDTDSLNLRKPVKGAGAEMAASVRRPSGMQSILALNEAELMNRVFEQSDAPRSSGQERATKAQFAAAPRAVEPTVMLSMEEAALYEGDNANWLIRSWQGKEEVIKLTDRLPLTIGRAEEQTVYIDRADGISRLHLELERQPGKKPGEHRYLAKDLGSRNGSFLNGEPMVPYKAYQLSPNDVIHLASLQGSSYTYRVRGNAC